MDDLTALTVILIQYQKTLNKLDSLKVTPEAQHIFDIEKSKIKNLIVDLEDQIYELSKNVIVDLDDQICKLRYKSNT